MSTHGGLDIDAAIRKLEADLEALRRAKAILEDVGEPGRAAVSLAMGKTPKTKAAPTPGPRKRGGVPKSPDEWRALLPWSKYLASDTARKALELRAAGKMPDEIAKAIRMSTGTAVSKLLYSARKYLERCRQHGGKPARKNAAKGKTSDDEGAPARPILGPDGIATDAELDRQEAIAWNLRADRRPGANELVHRALEVIRAPAPALAFEPGRIVVVRIDEGTEQLAILRANRAGGFCRIRRCGAKGREVGRRDRVLAAGEVLRYATDKEIAWGHPADYIEQVRLKRAPIKPDAVLPPGFRNIA